MSTRHIRKIENREPKNTLFKLVFLLTLIALGLWTPVLINQSRTPKKITRPKLPKFSIPKNINFGKLINFEALKSQGIELTTEIQQQVLGQTNKIITKTASQAAETVSSAVSKTVFDTALKPIIKQIDNLPPDQQKRAKELICK